MPVRIATTLAELTRVSPSFVRLDPAGTCPDCAALEPLWVAAANAFPDLGVFSMSCKGKKLKKLCDRVSEHFLGRAFEVAEVVQLFTHCELRCVAITGP